MSFTNFSYSGLSAGAMGINFTLTNTGVLDGAEIAQLYLGFPAATSSPPQQLKGFQKVPNSLSRRINSRKDSIDWDFTYLSF